MAYSHLTKAQMRIALAALLQDAGYVFWAAAELDLYLAEAMRTFGVMSGYWKDRTGFASTAATPFYDLSAKIPTYFVQSLKDQDVIAQMEYHLIEPPTPTAWSGTEMFSLTDLTQALQRRRNQFLVETGCVISHDAAVAATPAPVNRFTLSDSVIDVRRLAWKNADNSYTNLWREDEDVSNDFTVGWNITPAVPATFSVGVTPPLQVQLFPPAALASTLDMLSVNAGATLNPAVGVLLGIPDDFAWVVKWGALADLLRKDAEASDPMRAEYCQQRWAFGLEIAKLGPSILQAYVNNNAVPVDTLASLDAYYANWMNETPGVTQFIGMCGLNMLALAPLAGASALTVTLDLVKTTPVPVLDADYVQIGREELDVVLGYAVHLAEWKKGTFEIQQSVSGWQNLVKMAALKNGRLAASTKLVKLMLGHAADEERERPRVEEREENAVA